MNMSATIARTNDTNTAISDATSFLQTQDGALSVAGDVLSRMSELKTMADDPTKNTSDIANYDAEFTALQGQLTNLTQSTFNGISLFASGGSTLSVSTSADGTLSQNITQADLDGKTSTITGATNLAGVTVSQLSTAISDVAAQRAENGAESSSLGYASQFLSVDSTNLQSANSLITDVDVASESTAMAKDNILVQAGTSMLSQANSSAQTVLKLLQ
jgi:flagellin